MTVGWIVRGVMVSICISLAALCVERLLARTNHSSARNQRWVWIVAMFASIGVPLASLWAKWGPPIFSAIVGPNREMALVAETAREGGKIAVKVVPGATDFVTALFMSWMRFVESDHGLSVRAVVLSFLALSAIGLSLFVAVHLWIRRRRMDWADGVVEGVKVRVASSVGPAVVGFRNPEIVVPVWVLGAPQETQRAIIRHEHAHIVAGDSRTLAVCGLLLAAMPWNVVLWWQYRRLRAAIETDCDARVLADGIDVRQYGAMLLNVATRSIPVPLLSPAFCANPSLIERRIRAMTSRSFRFVHLQFVGLACVALVMLGMSVDLSAPIVPSIRYKITGINLPISFHGTLQIVPGQRTPEAKSWLGIKDWSQQYGSVNGQTTAPFVTGNRRPSLRLTSGEITIGHTKTPSELKVVTVASLGVGQSTVK